MPMRIVLKFKLLLLSPFSKSKPSPPLRFADVLLLQDRLLHTDGCSGPPNCSKPRRFAARLFFCFHRGKLTNKVHDDGKKEERDVAPPDHVTDGPDSSPVAESKDELQKITELRIQMESLLQTVKEGLLNKDPLVSKNSESNEGDGISSKVLFDQKCDDAPKEEDRAEGMDRLEAELEVELERLQLLLDSGKFLTNPPERTIEAQRRNGKSRPDWRCGVPPYELERKLHELLETRREQQITELQAALGIAKKELREKEREISWWKDTAHLMLEHAKKPSLVGLQYVRHAQRLRREEEEENYF
ncbi:Actin-binding FH2 protein isoform 1 [Hibiscus syriacus]|uniref:Actin-binding FH2 protein isoform 1 n=1 Tax=Hibiscus syriacus TaxID=106335 RepID=A0A6A3AAX0_HIBSY|nr:Actin-binding FH2 protein isoform 1 [Hibiscus syriacus]